MVMLLLNVTPSSNAAVISDAGFFFIPCLDSHQETCVVFNLTSQIIMLYAALIAQTTGKEALLSAVTDPSSGDEWVMLGMRIHELARVKKLTHARTPTYQHTHIRIPETDSSI